MRGRVVWAALVLVSLISPRYAACADLSVNGEPPVGAFGVDTLDHILACHKLGMNLVYTYSADAGKKQLDLSQPMGKALAERKMKVMYILAGRFTRVRLARELGPQDTTIPVTGEERTSIEAFPPSGALTIEGERISYAGRAGDAFTGCVRGIEGTQPAPHSAGLLLCNSEGLRQEILAVKDSPNLWGFWLVDDARPYEGDSLREMSRVIRQCDRRPDGAPYNHVIVMGVGGASAMDNFDSGVCDALGVYLYPYRKGKLDGNVRRQLAYIVTRAKALQPAIGLIGIQQAFGEDTSPVWKDMPKPEEVREDILSYFQCGAVGAMGFIYHWQRRTGPPLGFDASPDVCAVTARTYGEIREGKIRPSQFEIKRVDWFRRLVGAEAIPSGGAPACDLDRPDALEALVKAHPAGRVAAEPHEVGGRRYPVAVKIQRYNPDDPKSCAWPVVSFAGKLLATTDWSGARLLEQPVYNPQDHTLLLRANLADTDGAEWGHSGIPIPPGAPTLLRLPMNEAALLVNPKKIQRWMLWFDHPKEDMVLYLGSPTLVPDDGAAP